MGAKHMDEKTKVLEIKTLENDEKLQEYSAVLHDLRKDGVHQILLLSEEIVAIKKSKMIDASEKEAIIADKKRKIATAKKLPQRIEPKKSV